MNKKTYIYVVKDNHRHYESKAFYKRADAVQYAIQLLMRIKRQIEGKEWPDGRYCDEKCLSRKYLQSFFQNDDNIEGLADGCIYAMNEIYIAYMSIE